MNAMTVSIACSPDMGQSREKKSGTKGFSDRAMSCYFHDYSGNSLRDDLFVFAGASQKRTCLLNYDRLRNPRPLATKWDASIHGLSDEGI